jgi:hypothetical protein
MQTIILSEAGRTVEATARDNHLLIDPADLPAAMGYELKPEGLCRDSVCLPVKAPASLYRDGKLDIAAVAGALGRPVIVDAPAGIAAVALAPERRQQALDGLQAPSFTLSDLDGMPHQLEEWRGRKKLLFAFASW